ncbi:MAG: hypothetical protein ACFFH0_12715 [Promethearchaeota archaeon]
MSSDRGSRCCANCFKAIGVIFALLVALAVVMGLLSWLFEVPDTALDIQIDVPDGQVLYQYTDSEFQGDAIDYEIAVTNLLSEGLEDVTVSDSVGFEWTGTLDAEETRQFDNSLDWCAHQCSVIEAYVVGYLANGTQVSANCSCTIGDHIYGGSYELPFAISEDFVSCKMTGTGYCSGLAVRFRLTSNLNLTIDVEIKPGWVLINSGTGQNMILLEHRTIEVDVDVDVDVNLEGYCLDLHKGNPSFSQNFTIVNGTNPYGEDIDTLFEYLAGLSSSDYSVISVQLALWVLTDDISENEIPFDYYQRDIDDARELLEGAGFDVSGKNLFQD